jgi:HAD superfamily hydrolase (TIGR01484 family)
MSDYKLLALDMDGTLLNESQEVSEKNRKWIRAAQDAGIIVSLSTGRGYDSALPYAEDLGLNSPMVLVNGSEVWASPGTLQKRERMELDDIIQLRDIAIEHGSWYWAYSTTGVYNRENWTESYREEHWLKFGFYEDKDDVRNSIVSKLTPFSQLAITNSDPRNIEINPAGVSKLSGLLEVCSLLGIQMSQVVAMGDSMNDMAMIQGAGLGVAMGNAQDAVKEAADVTTGTNVENGVAQIIRQYLL